MIKSLKKTILCKQCQYFPTSIDQHIQRSIFSNEQNIEWECPCCLNLNQYQKYDLFVVNKNLVKMTYKKQPITVVVQINFREKILFNVLYHSIEVEDKLNNKIQQSIIQKLLTQQLMAQKSKWFQDYVDVKAALIKFIRKNTNKDKNMVYEEQYLVYLLDLLIKQYETKQIQKLIIKLKNSAKELQFSLLPRKDEKTIQAFLKLYCMMCFYQQLKWLEKVYSNQMQFYKSKNQPTSQQRITININFTNHKVIYQDQENENVLSLHPLHENSFASFIRLFSLQKQKQFFNIFSKQKKVFKLNTVDHHTSHEKIKQIFSYRTNFDVNDQFFKSIIKKLLLNITPEKLFYKFSDFDQQRVLFYVFNWKNLQKQYLLDTYEDNLTDQPYQKDNLMSGISPFKRKSTNFQFKSENTQQEEYLYL